MLYPLSFKEIFIRKPWGGDGITRMLKKKTPPKTGESWEIVSRKDKSSVIKNGQFQNEKLYNLIQKMPEDILGHEILARFGTRFPLIIKFVYARERVSLQVHPSDEFVKKYGIDDSGKTEAWYVVGASPEAKVIKGVLPGTSVEDFLSKLNTPEIDKCLNIFPVKPGDLIFITPGTIHSCFGDVLMLEVQQNSDVTFRFTDWQRADEQRPINIKAALEATEFYHIGMTKTAPVELSKKPYKRKLLIKCPEFVMEEIEFTRRRIKIDAHPDRFKIYVFLNGSGNFIYSKNKRMPFKMGDTFLIPANIGTYYIASLKKCNVICIFIE